LQLLLFLPLLGFGFHAATCAYTCKHYIKKLKERRDIVEVGSKKQFTGMQPTRNSRIGSEIEASCMHEYNEQDGGEMAG
jgi:hypothetical protein